MKHEIKVATLSNGLQLLGECAPERKSAAIGFFVRTGSRDEQPAESGVSHFLEHMMFKGTAKRQALDITFELGAIGAQANAFTSEENTVYYAAILPEYFERMQELLSDMLRPSLDRDEYNMEKKVILEEIALYKDRPQFFLFEHASRDYYGDHPAGNSVLGSNESISDLDRDEMQAYFDRRYSPSNMVLVASGAFDWDRFVGQAGKECGGWRNFKTDRFCKSFRRDPIQKVYRKKNITQAHMVFLGEGASAQAEERYAFSVLAMILGDSTGSRLYWELIDSGLADSAGADNDERDGTGAFSVYASTEPERLDRVAEIIRRVLDGALDFSDAEMERAKTKLISRMVLGGELPMGRLMSLGLEWQYRKTVETLPEVIARVRGVSKKEIQAAAGRIPFSGWSEFRLLPE